MDSLAGANHDAVSALRLLLPIVRELRRTIIFSEAHPKNLAGEWIADHDEDQALAAITDEEALEELRQIDEAIAAAESCFRQ